MNQSTFGFTENGQKVESIVLRPESGQKFEVEILTYGATLRRLVVPDRIGCPVDVVLGCDTVQDYEKSHNYLGCVVGRVTNRIKNGRFELDGKNYQLNINNGPHHLHGGFEGFNMKNWSISSLSKNHVTLNYVSESGDEKYPGEVRASVTYSTTWEGGAENLCKLGVRYGAMCTSKTPVNLANHSYFNLTGLPSLENHQVIFNADRYLPVDQDHLTIGRIESVSGTLFDFEKSQNLMQRMAEMLKQHPSYAYDNYFCMKDDPEIDQRHQALKMAAEIYAPSNGIRMSVKTTYPGFQFYTGDYLENHPKKSAQQTGACQSVYGKRSGFCIEAHKYPDAVNNPDFPTVILEPLQKYDESVEYIFGSIK